jgi:hypothetical protein
VAVKLFVFPANHAIFINRGTARFFGP